MMCSPLVADPYFSDQAAKAQAITRPTAAYTSRRAAPGGLQLPRPGGDPASTCATWRAIAEQLARRSAAPEQPREIPRRGNLSNPLLSAMLSKSRTNDLDWLWRRNRDISEQSRRPLGGTKTKMKR